MNSTDMKKRTFEFAIAIARFLLTVPKSQPYVEYSRQLARCSGSVGANYRAACRAKSRKDFIYKLTIVEEEGDESMYWLEIFKALMPEREDDITPLHNEANEITAIIVSSINTTRRNS